MKVQISQINNNPFNTRQDYGDLTGLVASLKKYGLHNQFIVRKNNENYQLAFGSRRLRALEKAGISEVEIEHREISDADMAMIALSENKDRKDLNPIELARAYNVGLKVSGLGVAQFAEIMGDSENKVRYYLSILTLPNRIFDKVNKYTLKELVCLARANKYSKSLFMEMEKMIEEKGYSEPALLEIIKACSSIYESNLPERKKIELAMKVLWEDYSSLGKNQYKQIFEFGIQILKETMITYYEQLKKTERAREAVKERRKEKNKVKSIKDMRNPDRNIDNVIEYIREVPTKLTTALERDYPYSSKKARGRFDYWTKKLYAKLEEIISHEKKS